MRKTLAIVVVSALMLSACGGDIGQAEDANDLKYVQDIKTDLCFSYTPGYESSSRSYVPCTPEVLREINN